MSIKHLRASSQPPEKRDGLVNRFNFDEVSSKLGGLLAFIVAILADAAYLVNDTQDNCLSYEQRPVEGHDFVSWAVEQHLTESANVGGRQSLKEDLLPVFSGSVVAVLRLGNGLGGALDCVSRRLLWRLVYRLRKRGLVWRRNSGTQRYVLLHSCGIHLLPRVDVGHLVHGLVGLGLLSEMRRDRRRRRSVALHIVWGNGSLSAHSLDLIRQ